jgi:transcription antitermination factor NusG
MVWGVFPKIFNPIQLLDLMSMRALAGTRSTRSQIASGARKNNWKIKRTKFLRRRPKTVRHARKLTNVAAAFFPRYLFIHLDLTRDRWHSVNGTFGVSRLIMQGELPHPVPRGIVETMIAAVDASGFLRLEENLKIGSRVRLMAGPFAEQLGTLDRLDDSGRVRVLLQIMGAIVPVQLERKIVTAA